MSKIELYKPTEEELKIIAAIKWIKSKERTKEELELIDLIKSIYYFDYTYWASESSTVYNNCVKQEKEILEKINNLPIGLTDKIKPYFNSVKFKEITELFEYSSFLKRTPFIWRYLINNDIDVAIKEITIEQLINEYKKLFKDNELDIYYSKIVYACVGRLFITKGVRNAVRMPDRLLKPFIELLNKLIEMSYDNKENYKHYNVYNILGIRAIVYNEFHNSR